MIQVGTSLSDVVGTDVTFAASSGPSSLGPVLEATGFDAQEQDIADFEPEDAGIAGLVGSGLKAKPFTP